MVKEIQLVLPPEIAFDAEKLNYEAKKIAGFDDNNQVFVQIIRRSIDARGRQVRVNISVKVFSNENLPSLIFYKKPISNVSKCPQAIVIGAGPAGLFAAMRLVELGIKPIVIERGKNVKDRRRDLAALNKEHIVNPDSNYCFGEGGAGTYSDGKLYTRSDKRGDVRRILEILVAHGAHEDILIDAHPHIGTNKLPKLIEGIRETIIFNGGEIYFEERVTDFIIEDHEIKGVTTLSGNEYSGIGVILATGHSARDIFQLLDNKKIAIEAKPFALGVRVEHSQQYIDSIQYHCETRGEYLPPSSYSLVAQVPYKGVEKGVFSFCMCPGGIIAPCATSPGEIVVNGWSPSKRNNPFANSGIVVSVDENDWKPYLRFGALAGLEYQKAVEQKACELAGGGQTAPAQLLQDFVNSRLSNAVLPCSYQPGLKSVLMDEILPIEISTRLKGGFKAFGAKMKGYLSNDAQIVGVESRTSSPVRIPRDKATFEHTQIKRFFPCGEGAGYAGGIVSAAMDGEKCAEMLAKNYL
ncbi:MAG: NAD(P)/FAD-dependent oxidoreductase [Cytophagales bacterium]